MSLYDLVLKGVHLVFHRLQLALVYGIIRHQSITLNPKRQYWVVRVTKLFSP